MWIGKRKVHSPQKSFFDIPIIKLTLKTHTTPNTTKKYIMRTHSFVYYFIFSVVKIVRRLINQLYLKKTIKNLHSYQKQKHILY